MSEGCLGVVTGEHASDLPHALLPGNGPNVRLRHGGVRLGDHVVVRRHDRDLRQVRHHDDLVRLGKACKDSRQRHRRGTAHAGVNLVEHQRLSGVRLPQDHLAGKHDAGHLASGGYLAQGARAQPGPGPVHELHLAGTDARPLLPRQALAGNFQAGGAHLQEAHLLGDRLGKPWGTLVPDGVECVRLAGKNGFRPPQLFLRLPQELVAVLRGVNDCRCLLPTPEDVVHARAIRAHEPLELRHARLQRLQLLGVNSTESR